MLFFSLLQEVRGPIIQAVLHTVDEEKKIDKECTSQEQSCIYSLYLSSRDKIYSQWLTYNNLVILGYKKMTIILIIVKKDCF